MQENRWPRLQLVLVHERHDGHVVFRPHARRNDCVVLVNELFQSAYTHGRPSHFVDFIPFLLLKSRMNHGKYRKTRKIRINFKELRLVSPTKASFARGFQWTPAPSTESPWCARVSADAGDIWCSEWLFPVGNRRKLSIFMRKSETCWQFAGGIHAFLPFLATDTLWRSFSLLEGLALLVTAFFAAWRRKTVRIQGVSHCFC